MRKPVIDFKKIESDLIDLAGEKPANIPKGSEYLPPPHIKFRRGNGSRLAIRVDDKAVTFSINPKKIRTDQQLQSVITDCQKELSI